MAQWLNVLTALAKDKSSVTQYPCKDEGLATVTPGGANPAPTAG